MNLLAHAAFSYNNIYHSYYKVENHIHYDKSLKANNSLINHFTQTIHKILLTISTSPAPWIFRQSASTISALCSHLLSLPPPDWKHKTQEMYIHPHFNISKCHRLSSYIAYSPNDLDRLTGSTKRNQTLEIPCHEKKIQQNITKWTPIIGQHDSCFPVLLFPLQ